MSWIMVDRDGERFMNEYEPYAHDTGHGLSTATIGHDAFPRPLPAFMLFDEPRPRDVPGGALLHQRPRHRAPTNGVTTT
jgi:hypothetical protein